MTLPVSLPIQPMLAKATTTLPSSQGWSFEPKWDGFRVIVLRDGDSLELQSRGSKPLTRYFPEVVAGLKDKLPERVILDGEIVVQRPTLDGTRLDWDALSARIHPAASRIEKLSGDTPASVVAFDLLALDDVSLMDEPFARRREELEKIFSHIDRNPMLHLTRATSDVDVAQRWFEQFEGAGLDGVMAKALDGIYEPNKRSMLKLKHKRTAEAVLLGYRIHKSGNGVGSLLLGLYTDDGTLINVGGISAFTAKRRLELIDELDDLVVRTEDGEAARGETDRSRFSSSKDVSFVPLRPERVVEVAFDQLEGHRFRHAVTFLRWRPDREPSSCSLAQVDRAPAYDLAKVLSS